MRNGTNEKCHPYISPWFLLQHGGSKCQCNDKGSDNTACSRHSLDSFFAGDVMCCHATFILVKLACSNDIYCSLKYINVSLVTCCMSSIGFASSIIIRDFSSSTYFLILTKKNFKLMDGDIPNGPNEH